MEHVEPGGYLHASLAGASAWEAMRRSPLPVLGFQTAGRLLLASQAAVALLGHPVEVLSARGIDILDAAGPPGPGAADDVLVQVAARGGTVRTLRQVRFADGRAHLVDVLATRLDVPGGDAAILAVLHALPAGRPAAEGRERGYRELVEDAPVLLARFDAATGRVLLLNRAIERLTGRPLASFLADPQLYEDALAADSRARWGAAFARAVAAEIQTLELAFEHRDGRRLLVEQVLYPVFAEGGRVAMIEATAHEVTAVRHLERMRTETELRHALDRMKSQLLANVSHELRTPLVSIKGYNELLLREALGPLTPRQRRGLEIAGTNIERLVELIESLLDFAKIEEERLELARDLVDLRGPLARAIEEQVGRSPAIGVRGELPPAPLFVRGDRARLTQIFRALLGNAQKFSESVGATEIVVAARRAGAVVEVSIADQGIGIPVEAQARIFDRFYQVDGSTTRRFGGAGLGLSLANELARLHEGVIRVESAEGRGSTFCVSLPLAEDAPSAERPGRPLVLVGAPLEEQRRLRALIEDAFGGEVDVLAATPGPAEVARRARRHRPDLVLLALGGAFDASPGVAREEEAVHLLKADPETSLVPVIVMARGAPRPVGRAEWVVEAGDGARLRAGLDRLLGPFCASARPAPQPPRVVVVEDEEEILDFTRFILEREGYEVVCFTSGGEALRHVDAGCGLVVLDIALEDADGIQICRTLKTRPETREVPVLIMTALSTAEVRQVSLAAGADGYVVKPFGMDEFLRQVRLHVRAAPGPGSAPGPQRTSGAEQV